MAVDLLVPGGVLVNETSCLGHVTREDFLYMLLGGGRAKRARYSGSGNARGGVGTIR